MGRKYFKKNKKDWGKKKKYRLSTRVVGGFPSSARVHLKLVQAITLDPATGSHTVVSFKANSINDPFMGTGGHNPSNSGRFWKAYNKVTITSSKIKVTSTQAQNGAHALIAGIVLAPNEFAVNTILNGGGYPAVIEQPYNSQRPQTYGTFGGSQIRLKRFKQTYNCSRFFDRPYSVCINAVEQSAIENFDPLDLAYFTIWTSSINGNNPDACNFLVEIDYSCAFSEPRVADYDRVPPPPTP